MSRYAGKDISQVNPEAVSPQVAVETYLHLTSLLVMAGQSSGRPGMQCTMETIFEKIERDHESASVLEAMTLLLGLAFENACNSYDPLKIMIYEQVDRSNKVYSVGLTLVGMNGREEQVSTRHVTPDLPKPERNPVPVTWKPLLPDHLGMRLNHELLEAGPVILMSQSVLKQQQALELYRKGDMKNGGTRKYVCCMVLLGGA